MSLIKSMHDAVRDARISRKQGIPEVAEKIELVAHKEYPRMPTLVLGPPRSIPEQFSTVLTKRRSYVHIHPRDLFTLNEISSLLGNALGVQGTTRRRYPSGGALFPIETYLCGPIVQNYPRAVFHYHPTKHALEHLWDMEEDFSFSNYVSAVTPEGTSLIVLTSVWERTSALYGDRGYSHALIEAGHMAQNLLLTATGLDIATRPIAGFLDDKLSDLLDLDTSREQVVYVIGLGGRHTHAH